MEYIIEEYIGYILAILAISWSIFLLDTKMWEEIKNENFVIACWIISAPFALFITLALLLDNVTDMALESSGYSIGFILAILFSTVMGATLLFPIPYVIMRIVFGVCKPILALLLFASIRKE